MESAIYNGFKVHNPNLRRLICVQHLRVRDEQKAVKLLAKTNKTASEKMHAKSEVLSDMYGVRTGISYEYGIVESYDCLLYTSPSPRDS